MNKVKLTKKEFRDKYLPTSIVLNHAIIPMSIKDDCLFEDNLDQLLESKWISVENELPKESKWLLVCKNEHGTQSVLFGHFDGSIFQVPRGLGGFSTIEPTHWQPMPEPPKE